MHMPKWLIGAIYDDQTPKDSIEYYLKADTENIWNSLKSENNISLPAPELVFEWMDIERLKPWFSGYKKGLDEKGEVGVTSRLTQKYRELTPNPAIALLMDRDLMIRHKLSEMFTVLVKDEYFNLDKDVERLREPSKDSWEYKPNRDVYRRFICCFGGISPKKGGMRRKDSTMDRCTSFSGSGCAGCGEALSCRHTCYWYLVGLMLGAYHIPRPNPHSPDVIKQIHRHLPYVGTPFIYHVF